MAKIERYAAMQPFTDGVTSDSKTGSQLRLPVLSKERTPDSV